MLVKNRPLVWRPIVFILWFDNVYNFNFVNLINLDQSFDTASLAVEAKHVLYVPFQEIFKHFCFKARCRWASISAPPEHHASHRMPSTQVPSVQAIRRVSVLCASSCRRPARRRCSRIGRLTRARNDLVPSATANQTRSPPSTVPCLTKTCPLASFRPEFARSGAGVTCETNSRHSNSCLGRMRLAFPYGHRKVNRPIVPALGISSRHG